MVATQKASAGLTQLSMSKKKTGLFAAMLAVFLETNLRLL